jgi:hypothetical protein
VKRDLYIVGPRKKADAKRMPWVLTFNRTYVVDFPTQAGAVSYSASVARYRLNETGRVSELQIKGKDGQIKDCRTYGRDPKGTKG